MKLKNKNGAWAFALLLVTSVLGLVMSCTMGIGDTKPYLYNRKGSGDGENITEEEIVEEEVEGEIDENDPFYKEPYAKKEYQFDGDQIGEFIFKVSFDGQNVPSYSFVKKGAGAWALQDTKTNKYYYNGTGDGNMAQSYGINPANIYRYNGYNPLSGKKGGRMERFQFYALLNSKAVVADLNQYLIAVDTYSKFVFAYGKITKTKSIVGQQLPVKFEAVEKHGSKIAFYQYDPIGAVRLNNGNLEINLYEEYRNEMRQSAVNFFPKVHNASRAIATYNTPGLSPYYFVEDLSNLPPFLQKVAGKTFGKRDKKSYKYVSNGTEKTVDENSANMGFDVTHDDWEFSSNGKNLTHIRKDDLLTKTLTEEEFSYVSENDDGMTATYQSATGAQITLQVGGTNFKDLFKDGGSNSIGNSDFKDPGADFILRVRAQNGSKTGMKFIKTVYDNGARKTVVYQFSADGGSVTTTNMTGQTYNDWASGSGTYHFIQERDGDKTQAVYQFVGGSIRAPWYLLGIECYNQPFYGLNLLDDGYKEVQRTRASKTTDPWKEQEGTIDGFLTTVRDYFSKDCEVGVRTADSVPQDEYAHEDWLRIVQGLKFAHRSNEDYYYYKESANNKAFATGPGLWLYDFEFSEDGKTLTRTNINWKTNEKQTEEYKFDESQKLTTLQSAIYICNRKQRKVQYIEDSQSGKLNVKTINDTWKDDSDGWKGVAADAYAYDDSGKRIGWQDPGPDFVLRVRNTTYSGSGYTYNFGEFGQIVDNNNKKYYFAATRDGQPSTTAVYWEGGVWLIYRGLKLSEDGKKLWWTPTAWASIGTTDPTTLATSAEASRTQVR